MILMALVPIKMSERNSEFDMNFEWLLCQWKWVKSDEKCVIILLWFGWCSVGILLKYLLKYWLMNLLVMLIEYVLEILLRFCLYICCDICWDICWRFCWYVCWNMCGDLYRKWLDLLVFWMAFVPIKMNEKWRMFDFILRAFRPRKMNGKRGDLIKFLMAFRQ